MRRHDNDITPYTEVEVSVSDVMEELSSQELLAELLNRGDIAQLDGVNALKLICRVLGLPEWYYLDKDRIKDEIGKLF